MKTIICLLIAVSVVHTRERRRTKESFVDDCSDEDFDHGDKYKIYKRGCPCKESESSDSSHSSSECDEYDYYHKEKEPECKYCKEPKCEYYNKPKYECYEKPKCQCYEKPKYRPCDDKVYKKPYVEKPKCLICEYPEHK